MKNKRESATLPKNIIFDKSTLLSQIKPDDCFGTFEAGNPLCNVCHDQFACASLVQFKIKEQRAKVEKEKGPFLDQTTLPTEEELIKQFVPGTTYSSISQWIKDNYVCPDSKTLEVYLDAQIVKHSIKFKGGAIC